MSNVDTETAGSNTPPTTSDQRPLTRVLAALFDTARAAHLETKSIGSSADRITISVPREPDVHAWAAALHLTDNVTQVRGPHLGIVLTSFNHEFGGWRINIRHVLRCAPGGTSE